MKYILFDAGRGRETDITELIQPLQIDKIKRGIPPIPQPKYAEGTTVYPQASAKIITDSFYDWPSGSWHYFLGDDPRPYPESNLAINPPASIERILEVADYIGMALDRNALVEEMMRQGE